MLNDSKPHPALRQYNNSDKKPAVSNPAAKEEEDSIWDDARYVYREDVHYCSNIQSIVPFMRSMVTFLQSTVTFFMHKKIPLYM